MPRLETEHSVRGCQSHGSHPTLLEILDPPRYQNNPQRLEVTRTVRLFNADLSEQSEADDADGEQPARASRRRRGVRAQAQAQGARPAVAKTASGRRRP